MRELEFKYILLDKNGAFKKNLTTVSGCEVSYDSLTALKMSARITMKEDTQIDYHNDMIQPVVSVNGKDYPLGVFLIASPKRAKGVVTTRDMILYSTLQLIAEDIVEERLYIPSGENVVNTVIRLLNVKCEIEPSSKSTLVEREYEIGTSKLEIVNDLLKSINYTSLYVDMQGLYIAKPYILPSDRVVDIEYKEGVGSILIPYMEIDFDTFSVPNRILRYTNHPDINPPLIAIYENTNIDSPTSTANRRVVTDAKPAEVADLETLIHIAKKDCYEATDVFENLIFETAINPVHGYSDCVYIKNDEVSGNYIETSWSIKFEVGAKMKHTARRVITV